MMLMRIVFFAKGDRRLPSSRTRAYLVSDYLSVHGIPSVVYQIKTRSFWNVSIGRLSELLRNIRILATLGDDDIVICQRTVHQVDFLALLLLRKIIFRRGYVFDFDDAIFLEKGHAQLKTRLIIRHANCVLAGSEFLREYALQYNPRVRTVTTLMDMDEVFVPRDNPTIEPKVVFIWTGTPSHIENMRLLVPAFARFAKENAPARLVLVGGGPAIHALFHAIPGLEVEAHNIPPSSDFWQDPHKIASYLKNGDVGLYPLQKTEFNKGKDIHKGKEYGGCGLALAVSNWGENPLLVRDNIDGVLIGDGEWYEKLRRFLDDREYLIKLKKGGREFAEHIASFKVHLPEVLSYVVAVSDEVERKKTRRFVPPLT
jgi:glycosyltransferase involved in cell wall biosynthesis